MVMTRGDTVPRPIHRLRRVHYDTYANLPASGNRRGDLGFATDRLVLYRWSGAAWQEISIHCSAGLAGAIPTASELPDGSIYYETDAGNLKQVQAAAWEIINAKSVSAWVVSDDLQQSADTERSQSATAPTKTKEIELDEPIPEIRVKFDLKAQVVGGISVYGRVYINGAAVGTLRTKTNSDTYTTYSEDFSVGYIAGDLIQLYQWMGAGGPVSWARNFRLYAIKQFDSMEGETLETPINLATTLLTTVNTD